jgi:hypothetical protein
MQFYTHTKFTGSSKQQKHVTEFLSLMKQERRAQNPEAFSQLKQHRTPK